MLFVFNRDRKNAIANKLLLRFVLYTEKMLCQKEQHNGGFQNSNFTLTDDERSGRPVELNDNKLNNLLHKNLCQSSRELGEQLGCDHKTVLNYLHSMEKV